MRSTGVGSLPGTDFAAAIRMVCGTQSVIAFPELPARPDSGMIARTLGLTELEVDNTADGWRLGARAGAARARAAKWWTNDLDDFEEFGAIDGAPVKISVTGPWTLATQVRLPHPTMTHVLADPIAVRDLAEGLGEAVQRLLAEFTRRFGVAPIIQLDEPALTTIMGGQVPTFSGLEKYRVPDRSEIIEILARVTGPATWLHSCAAVVSPEILTAAEITGLSGPLPGGSGGLDEIGAWLDSGGTWAAGVVPSWPGTASPGVDRIVTDTLTVLRRLDMDPELLDERVILTPECGLAGWTAVNAGRCFDDLARAGEVISQQLA